MWNLDRPTASPESELSSDSWATPVMQELTLSLKKILCCSCKSFKEESLRMDSSSQKHFVFSDFALQSLLEQSDFEQHVAYGVSQAGGRHVIKDVIIMMS